MKNFTLTEIIENNVTEFYLTEWEANGYDDSDGDILTYDYKENKIINHPWTTRFAMPCDLSVKNFPHWSKGVEYGLFDEVTLKKTFFEKIWGDLNTDNEKINDQMLTYIGWGWEQYVDNNSTKMNLPYIYKKDLCFLFGKGDASFGELFNPQTNEILSRVVTVTSTKLKKSFSECNINVGQLVYDKCSIYNLCDLLSDIHSCSHYSRSWVGSTILGIISPIVDLGEDIDNALVCRAKEIVDNKREDLILWANKKFPNKTEVERNKIVECTLRKYYPKECALIG